MAIITSVEQIDANPQMYINTYVISFTIRVKSFIQIDITYIKRTEGKYFP